MVLEFLKGSSQSPIDEVEATFVRMSCSDNDVFLAATDVLFGGRKSKETKREVPSIDHTINEARPSRRRLLMIHAAVGTGDLPLVLQYASIVKDAERIGDYDPHVKAACKSKGAASDAVGRALYFRYLKRMTAHVMNILTALVQPLDRLDYHDETRQDKTRQALRNKK